MLKWEKTGRIVKGDESAITEYRAAGEAAEYCIESRKRQIPHSNRPGTWAYTSYFLIFGAQEKEYQRLQDAKAAAEKIEDAQPTTEKE